MNRSNLLFFLCAIIILTAIAIDQAGLNPHEKSGINKKILPILHVKGISYQRLSDIKRQMEIQGTVDAKHGTVSLHSASHVFKLVIGVPVVDHNGIFEAIDHSPIVQQGDVLLPVSFSKKLSQMNILVNSSECTTKARKMDKDELGYYLSFVNSPIAGAYVSKVDSSLPGTPREYRNGIHEGLDWYSYVCGVTIDEKTKVLSVADGIVVRADHDYKEMTIKERKAILEIAKNEKITPEYILDKLRGRSVWVQHEKGILCRYIHLSSIVKDVKVGKKVKAGEILGFVGNSGTSEGVNNKKEGLHLHLDLLLYGNWFWNAYTLAERREILERVFNKGR